MTTASASAAVDQGGQFLDLARAEQGGGRDLAQAHDLFGAHVEVERAGQAHRLLKPLLGRAAAVAAAVRSGWMTRRPDQRDGVVDQILKVNRSRRRRRLVQLHGLRTA